MLAGGAVVAVDRHRAVAGDSRPKPEPVKDPNAWREELAQTLKKPVAERTRPNQTRGTRGTPVEPSWNPSNLA